MSCDEIIMAAAPRVEMFDLVHDMAADDGGEPEMMVMVELDELFTFKEYIEYRTGRIGGSRFKRKAPSDDRRLWRNCSVFYELASGDFNSREQGIIQQAIEEWQNFTCLTFTRSLTEQSRIRFRNGAGCYSRLGRTGGVQPIGLAPGCRTKGVVVHEIGHAIGWIHEQARPDRDEFITVNFNQIPPNWRPQYQKAPEVTINDRDVTYDYDSVMHYSGRTFGPRTIVTKDPAAQNRIGQRNGLSFRDIKIANLMYDCAKTMSCRQRTCPGEGFQGKDCNCYCPGPSVRNPIVQCEGIVTSRPTPSTTTRRPTPPPSTEIPPPPECRDLREDCADLRRRNSCVTDAPRMSIFCRVTCNLCDTDPSQACMDYDDACPLFAANKYCERDGLSEVFKKQCPLSCGVCTPPDPCQSQSSPYGSGSGVMTSALSLVVLTLTATFISI